MTKLRDLQSSLHIGMDLPHANRSFEIFQKMSHPNIFVNSLNCITVEDNTIEIAELYHSWEDSQIMRKLDEV